MSKDSVVLEIAVAQIDHTNLPLLSQLWREIDTSAISIEQRQLLDQNGLRAGLVSNHIPAVLQQLLEPKPIVEEELNSWELQLFEKGLLKPETVYLLHDGIQNRLGEMHPVPVSHTIDEQSWIVYHGNKTTAGAGTFVRAVFEVKTYPKGDGTVRISCTPALHLGQPKTQIGVSQEEFVYETTQDKQLLGQLAFDACLRSGESLVVGPTSDLGDLGGLFFSQAANDLAADDRPVRILLVRVLQTQLDDLFDSGSVPEKLTTTSLY